MSINKLHSVSIILYFGGLLCLSAIFSNPICEIIVLIGVVSCALLADKKGTIQNLLHFCLPISFLIILINPIFNHNGITVMFYIFDNPITFEAFFYGIYFALSFCIIVVSFNLFTFFVDSDKLQYLLKGKFSIIADVLCLSLGLIPRLQKKLRLMREYKSIEKKGKEEKGIKQYFYRSTKELTALLSWSIEDVSSMLFSMRARGYGNVGKTKLKRYKFRNTDFVFILFTIFLLMFLIYFKFVFQISRFRFYPIYESISFDFKYSLIYLLIFIYSFLPIFFEMEESLKWKYLKSKI